jgi:hypothetical protein
MAIEYFIYITGDSSRTVQISYLGCEILDTPPKNRDMPDTSFGNNPPVFINYSDRNITFTEKVQLPFFKKVNYIRGGHVDEDVYLDIVSENDSTTKAIIFEYGLLLADSCPVSYVFETENAAYWNECFYCKDLSKDSVLTYLKDVRYPCYLEFAKGETFKRVRLCDQFQWSPHE